MMAEKNRAGVKGGTERIEAFVQRAWDKGKRIESFLSHRTQTYLNNLLGVSREEREIRVFGNEIYVFSPDAVLITVLQMPQKVLRRNNKKD